MADKDILEKIKALRSKVNNAASTEAEVEAAAKLVAKLMMKHDVTENLLEEKEDVQGIHATTDKMKNDIEWVIHSCWKPIEDFTETKCYRSDGKLNYIGLEHDVEMALYLYELITMSAKRGWLRHSAKMFDEQGMTRTKGMRVSYYVGFGERMSEMLRDLHNERMQNRDTATGTAVVIRKQDIIKSKMGEMGLKLYKSRGKSTGRIDGNAYSAGQSAASRVNLNRPFGATKSAGSIE